MHLGRRTEPCATDFRKTAFRNDGGFVGASFVSIAAFDVTQFDDPLVRDRARVFAALAAGVARSRREIMDLLGLRSTTASRAVAGLLSRRLVLEAPGEKLGRGRPAATLVINPRRLGVSLIHVASRSFVGVLLDLDGHVLECRMLAVEADVGNAGIGAALFRLSRLLAAAAPRGMEHAGTVVSISGVVDVRRRQWLVSSRWPLMQGLDIAAATGPGAGPVEVVRQLDAELRARVLADPAAFTESTVLLHWGWGIGMAYAVAGQPFGEATSLFGEIGHWRIGDMEALRCGCGGHGCLETVAGLWSLLPGLRQHWPELADDEDTLLDQLRELDLLVLPEMQAALRHMARALANVCRILFPASVIVSSPLMGNARFWAEFDALFRAEELMRGMPSPVLRSQPPSGSHGAITAAGPLLGRALATMLR